MFLSWVFFAFFFFKPAFQTLVALLHISVMTYSPSVCFPGELRQLQHQLENRLVHEMERQSGDRPERGLF